jgi:hypothetical protein
MKNKIIQQNGMGNSVITTLKLSTPTILNDQTAPPAILHPIHEKSTYELYGIQKSKKPKTKRN